MVGGSLLFFCRDSWTAGTCPESNKTFHIFQPVINFKKTHTQHIYTPYMTSYILQQLPSIFFISIVRRKINSPNICYWEVKLLDANLPWISLFLPGTISGNTPFIKLVKISSILNVDIYVKVTNLPYTYTHTIQQLL